MGCESESERVKAREEQKRDEGATEVMRNVEESGNHDGG